MSNKYTENDKEFGKYLEHIYKLEVSLQFNSLTFRRILQHIVNINSSEIYTIVEFREKPI